MSYNFTSIKSTPRLTKLYDPGFGVRQGVGAAASELQPAPGHRALHDGDLGREHNNTQTGVRGRVGSQEGRSDSYYNLL